jgi:hypothetical protein
VIDLDLTAAERKAYQIALSQSHPMRVTVRVLDQDEQEIGSLTAPESDILEGSVNVDVAATVSRQLQLTILDEKGKLIWDRNNPAETALFADKFIAVERGDWVEELERWVDVPVFWGPVTRFEREHPVVRIEAMGKEYLLQPPQVLFHTITVKKGTKIVEAIKKLTRAMGERRFDLPELDNRKVKEELSVSKHADVWARCKKLAKSIDRQLYYDGRGRLRMRKHPENPVFTFKQDVRRTRDEDFGN